MSADLLSFYPVVLQRLVGDSMQAYRHILVATDFSEFSEPAAQRAAELAQRYGADLTLIHILEHFPEDIPIDSIAPEDVDPQKFLTDPAHDDNLA